MLFARHFLFFPPVEADLSLALPDCEELNEVEQFCKNCETELHSSEPDVIQDICPHFISGIFPTAVFYLCKGDGSTHLMCSSAGLQKPENKKVKNESNKGNPYAGTNNYHLVKHCQAAVCLSA